MARDLGAGQRCSQWRLFTSVRRHDKAGRVGRKLQKMPRVKVKLLEAHAEGLRSAALRKSRFKDKRVFLEAFAGKSGLAKAAQRRGYAAMSLDIVHGEHHDLRRDTVLNTICPWVRSGLVWGLRLGMPCGSFSRARHAPISSRTPHALR